MCSVATCSGLPDAASRLVLAALVAVCVWWAPARADCSPLAWPLESDAEYLLAFGAAYSGGEGTSTHRGVDLAAELGSVALAPCAATVSFVGSVPGVGGGTVTAVTLAAADGLAITLLPLAGAEVRRGESVAEGAAVGGIAAGGDGSTAATHLHVGLRRGDVYLDPATMLTPPAVADGSSGATTQGAPASVADQSATALAATVREPEAPQTTTRVREASVRPAGAASASAVYAQGMTAGIKAAPQSGLLVSGQSLVTESGSSDSAAVAVSRTQVGARAAARTPRASGIVARAANVTGRLIGSLGTTWSAAFLGTLLGLGALWPIVRRRGLNEEQPEGSTASGGSDVAVAAGRC